jgi:hypothetical protein
MRHRIMSPAGVKSLLGSILLAALLVLLLTPWSPVMPRPGLDPSWQWVHDGRFSCAVPVLSHAIAQYGHGIMRTQILRTVHTQSYHI